MMPQCMKQEILGRLLAILKCTFMIERTCNRNTVKSRSIIEDLSTLQMIKLDRCREILDIFTQVLRYCKSRRIQDRL